MSSLREDYIDSVRETLKEDPGISLQDARYEPGPYDQQDSDIGTYHFHVESGSPLSKLERAAYGLHDTLLSQYYARFDRAVFSIKLTVVVTDGEQEFRVS